MSEMGMESDDAGEAHVETVEDQYYVEEEEPPQPQQPSLLMNYIYYFYCKSLLNLCNIFRFNTNISISDFYASNPWVWLICAIILWKIFQWLKGKFALGDRYEEWRLRREEDARAAEIKKNPDLYQHRMEEMDKVRRIQQGHSMSSFRVAKTTKMNV